MSKILTDTYNIISIKMILQQYQFILSSFTVIMRMAATGQPAKCPMAVLIPLATRFGKCKSICLNLWIYALKIILISQTISSTSRFVMNKLPIKLFCPIHQFQTVNVLKIFCVVSHESVVVDKAKSGNQDIYFTDSKAIVV